MGFFNFHDRAADEAAIQEAFRGSHGWRGGGFFPSSRAFRDPNYSDDFAAVFNPRNAATASNAGGMLTNNVRVGSVPKARAAAEAVMEPGEEDIRRALELFGQPDDYSQVQQYARARAQESDSAMLNALAAQFAGRRFEPVTGTYLKRSLAAREPLRIGNATISADGTVLEDPGAAREREAQRLYSLGELKMKLGDKKEARLLHQALVKQGEWRIVNSPNGPILYNTATGETMPLESQPYQPVSPTGYNVQSQIITSGVYPSEAVGFKGGWQSGVNKIADAFGFSNPQDPNRIATDRLEALGNQTQLYLQDTVPGKPSNYLLQMFEKQVVRPNKFFMGKAGAQTRAQATIAVIDIGLSDLADILNNPVGYSPDDLAKARNGYKRLNQLKAEYNTLLGSFNTPAVDEIDALVQQYLAPQ